MKVEDEIRRAKIELAHVKPRSRRRVELEVRLRDLVLKQLRRERRLDRAA